MAAKEIICILCIGVGSAPPVSDKCDYVEQILEGPLRDKYLLNRSDGPGARRTRRLHKDTLAACKKQQGEQK